jgi:3-oxoadipate enol-lactonase
MPTMNIERAVVHYEECGPRDRQSPPIVLLHGFPLDCRIFAPQLAALSERFRLIAPDFPGFGRSRGGDRPFTITSLADDVYTLLRNLGALPCVLGGLSMGGYVAQAFAKEHPSELKGLMLIDTKSEADTAEGKQKRDKMIEQARGADGSKAVADAMFPNMLTPEHAQRPDIAQPLREMMEACPARTIEQALAALRDREDYTYLLPSIAVPTLIVVGQQDAIAPPAIAEAMHRAIPRSTLAVIPDAGHLTTIEKPHDATAAIREFAQALE